MTIDALSMVRWSGVEGRPLVIAGPCSAESEEQVFETARRLATARIDYLRAGIWKARTRPNSFEGIGDRALPWLRRAGDRFGLRTATEVAHAQHVEAALEHGIDLLWIGARTTVNPFSVQEIANALRGTSVPVLIKNPTNPDLGLWLGALERVHGVGVRALGLIHRGFSTATPTRFRNAPMWDLLIEARRLLPELPVIVDPSHICGRRDLIEGIAQRAMDLGVEGLMVETHPNPDQAWSDAAQQITPERLAEILARTKVRRADSDSAEFITSIEELRERIDELDHEVLGILAQRMGLVDRIAECKRANNVMALQLARWNALLKDRTMRASELGLDVMYIKDLYDVIHRESIRRQTEIINNGASPGPSSEPRAPLTG